MKTWSLRTQLTFWSALVSGLSLLALAGIVPAAAIGSALPL